MRQPVPNIHLKLRLIGESRSPLASTLVVAGEKQFVVLTLAPLKTARLMGQGPRALWETRVYTFDPGSSVGLGTAPRYAVLSGTQDEALDRHEALVLRLEAGSFERETAREVLAPVRPLMHQAVETFRAGDPQRAVAALDEAIRIAGRMDLLHTFLPLYQEAYLMRALALECTSPDAAKAAYRDFIHLYAGLHSPHPGTVRGVARAREAIERLTPTPPEGSTRRHVPAGE
ncbi:MAG: hypothetical protein HYT85_09815, partial [candidate division NC10 bacterium]|nr:hypothetical protein [candidate division NC10 bacterium]